MSDESLSESERIRRQILDLRRSIDIQLEFGSAEAANRLRDKIGDLEKKLQEVSKHGRKN